MRKTIRKILSLLLGLTLTFTLTTSVSAAENINNNNLLKENGGVTRTITVNEYDLCKLLDKQIEKAIKEKDKDYIGDNLPKETYVGKFKSHIFELKEKDIEELKKMNIDNERINKIKNFDGSEDMMYAIGSELSQSISIYRYLNDAYNASGTKVKTLIDIGYEWSWSSTPVNNYKDAVGICWQADTYNLLCDKNSVYANIHYNDYRFSTVDLTSTAQAGISPTGQSITYNFNMTPMPNAGSATSGYLTFELENASAYIGSFQLGWGYGHSYLSVTPTLNYDKSLTVSFSPTWAVTTTNDTNIFYKSSF